MNRFKRLVYNGTSYLFELSSGSSGDERNRKAKSIDGNSLNYKVNLVNIEDSVDSPLGAGANGVSLVGKGTMQTNQVIFIFPPNQFVAPGTYTDTLKMTVTY